jgi:copper chaperone NosL
VRDRRLPCPARARSLALILCWVAAACRSMPDEPTAIVYDREACAHCHMLIGDPRYAAQLVTSDGKVVNFDDPGCALRYVAEIDPKIHRLWFRDGRGDRWIPAAGVGFVRGAETPMGYGLAAVDATTPGALSIAQATALVTGEAP